jgi:hypothetical protein
VGVPTGHEPISGRDAAGLISKPEGGEAEGVQVGVQPAFGAPAVLEGEEEGEFGVDLRAGLPEELVGEFEKPGEVVALVNAVFDRVVRWILFRGF